MPGCPVSVVAVLAVPGLVSPAVTVVSVRVVGSVVVSAVQPEGRRSS